jgi:hypothetical protein
MCTFRSEDVVAHDQVEYDFLQPKVLETLHALNQPASEDDSEYVIVESSTKVPVNENGGQSDGSKSNSHSRNTSQDDDDEEIVYTPPWVLFVSALQNYADWQGRSS